MPPQLLPTDFDERAAAAVRAFWSTRVDAASSAQGGSRGAVISGKTMDGFIDLVRHVAQHCGVPASAVFTNKGDVVLPGYFRATKNWDVLVVHNRQLLGVFEFKSQVGSFGNNFNNRSEEVIGAAADLWVAHHAGAYRRGDEAWVVQEPELPLLNPALQRDPTPPFLGWLMLLEDCEGSRRPVRVDEPHFRAFPEFTGASYARRYQILCERLVERQLYGAAALVLSDPEQGARSGAHAALSEATSLRRCFLAFAARLATRAP
jgi:hypothetical protein